MPKKTLLPPVLNVYKSTAMARTSRFDTLNPFCNFGGSNRSWSFTKTVQLCLALLVAITIAFSSSVGTTQSGNNLSPLMASSSDSNVSVSNLQRLVEGMKNSLQELGSHDVNGNNVVAPTDERLEEWACVIYESMSASSRTFHVMQHAFDVAADTDNIQKLSAFFHDCIYYTVDAGLSPNQNAILHGIIDERDDGVYLTKEPLERHTQMIVDIFGFTGGQKLNPFGGLNEFLSAALAIRCFSEYLRPRYLAEITACIEATIPFRTGKPREELYARVKKVNESYNLLMSDVTVIEAVQRASDFANRDVLNFSHSDTSFLLNTWKLLPESNIPLRQTHRVYRISDFSHALQKELNFLEQLDANTIYTNFRNDPLVIQNIDVKTEKAAQNINMAVTYIKCKQLAISVVAAFAELTGGDAPIALFVGDPPESGHVSPSHMDDRRIITSTHGKQRDVLLNDRVLKLLRDGRKDDSGSGSGSGVNFDISNSPFAAFLYGEIGDAGVKESFQHIVHPMDKDHARKLLLSLPKNCVVAIGTVCARTAITRGHKLDIIIAKVQNGETF